MIENDLEKDDEKRINKLAIRKWDENENEWFTNPSLFIAQYIFITKPYYWTMELSTSGYKEPRCKDVLLKKQTRNR